MSYYLANCGPLFWGGQGIVNIHRKPPIEHQRAEAASPQSWCSHPKMHTKHLKIKIPKHHIAIANQPEAINELRLPSTCNSLIPTTHLGMEMETHMGLCSSHPTQVCTDNVSSAQRQKRISNSRELVTKMKGDRYTRVVW